MPRKIIGVASLQTIQFDYWDDHYVLWTRWHEPANNNHREIMVPILNTSLNESSGVADWDMISVGSAVTVTIGNSGHWLCPHSLHQKTFATTNHPRESPSREISVKKQWSHRSKICLASWQPRVRTIPPCKSQTRGIQVSRNPMIKVGLVTWHCSTWTTMLPCASR